MRLNVGSGRTALDGFVNCDLYPGPNVDQVFDANDRWPFDDNSVDFIYSSHLLEHLPEPWTFFREAYRVLKESPEPNFFIRLPHGPSEAGIGDMTHLRYYTATSFACLQPGYNEEVRNNQYDTSRSYFGLSSIYLRVHPEARVLLKPLVRRWGLHILPFLHNGFHEMIVRLRALKSEKEIVKWMMRNRASQVPVAVTMYQHEYEGRRLGKEEAQRLICFGPYRNWLQPILDQDIYSNHAFPVKA